MEKKQKISVLMSLYKNDKPEWFKTAVESVCEQTLKPSELVLMIDGSIPEELQNQVNQLVKKYPIIKVNQLEQNMGLGKALEKGVPLCENELVARMDSDDIAKPDRLEKQLKFLTENELDIVGSDIEEFCDNPNEIESIREVPKTQEEIAKYIKTRNPFNHMTVMFKKLKVLEVGNYQDMHYCEDYYLWCRMYLGNAKMGNMSECLVRARMNKDTFKRRGGYKYFKSQKKLFVFMRKNKILNYFQYLKTVTSRFIIHVLMPGKLKEKIYKKHLRKNTDDRKN